MGFDAGQDHVVGIERLETLDEAGSVGARERRLLERRRVLEQHAHLRQRPSQPLRILLRRQDVDAETPGGGHEDLDVGHHVVAPLGVHGVEEPFLHVDDDQHGTPHDRFLQPADRTAGHSLTSAPYDTSAVALPPSFLTRLAIAATRSAGSRGLATCIWNPAESARVRSSARA